MSQLYPNCIPVVGALNICFYDLDKQDFKVYSKGDVLKDPFCENSETFTIKDVTPKGLELLARDGFLHTDEDLIQNPYLVPVKDHQWAVPSLITNTIIEATSSNGLVESIELKKLLNFLSQLNCRDMVLRFTEYIPLQELREVIRLIESSNANSLELLIQYHDEYYSDEFGELIMELDKVTYVIVESSPFEKNIENKIFFTRKKLNFTSKRNFNQFTANINLFSESQKHHSYFNKKLYVGPDGEIKNAPECKEEFGNIKEINSLQQLIEMINRPDFQKYWSVTKDITEGCKVCEFRYMCVDNRVPVSAQNGIWYHEQPCAYNPHTGRWNEEIVIN